MLQRKDNNDDEDMVDRCYKGMTTMTMKMWWTGATKQTTSTSSASPCADFHFTTSDITVNPGGGSYQEEEEC